MYLSILSATLAIFAATAQDTPPSRVIDGARMFSPDAVRKADATLSELSRRHQQPIVIETVEALPPGTSIEQQVSRSIGRVGDRALYILIAAREHKTAPVHVPPSLASKIKPEPRERIRESFTADFKAKKFDDGLMAAIETIGRTLAEARIEGGEPPPSAAPSLIRRDQIRLNLGGARIILAAAEAKAAELGLKSNLAVVDDGGHPIAFARMDGARPASAYTALTKAISAATTRAPTGPLPAGAATPDVLLNISLQNAAQASGGRFTALHGGVPIVVDGQVIGGVGAGGGTGEQDAEVVRAGIAALLAALERQTP